MGRRFQRKCDRWETCRWKIKTSMSSLESAFVPEINAFKLFLFGSVTSRAQYLSAYGCVHVTGGRGGPSFDPVKTSVLII